MLKACETCWQTGNTEELVQHVLLTLYGWYSAWQGNWFNCLYPSGFLISGPHKGTFMHGLLGAREDLKFSDSMTFYQIRIYLEPICCSFYGKVLWPVLIQN